MCVCDLTISVPTEKGEPMAEYIEREAAISASDILNFDEHYGTSISAIRRIPTADVAPVVHGKWDSIPNTYMCVSGKDGSYHGCATSCSVCHEINPNAYKTNYCPNCGARMDLEVMR